MKNYYKLHELYFKGTIPDNLKIKARIMMTAEQISAAYTLIILWLLESVINMDFWIKITVFVFLCIIFTCLMDILTGIFIKHNDL